MKFLSRNFLSQNKESTDPTIVVSNCLRYLLNRISEDFERKGYYWTKPWGVKRFESIILAKFILDYSFEKIAEDQLSDEDKISYYQISNRSLSELFNDEFSEVGINFEDMEEYINKKVQSYFAIRKDFRQVPDCYYQMYMLITGCKPFLELKEELKNKTEGLKIIRNHENFIQLVPQYEMQIEDYKGQISGLELAEIMLPHIMRAARQKIKNINLKKIKSLSKKLAKKDNS